MIPFNKPYMTGKELEYISEAHQNYNLAGDGYFTNQCNTWIEKNTGTKKALLTHSCTAALEIAAILADLKPGDEVIMPSYTFVSTANAFVLRGAIPVFVDIHADTFNIDETKIEAAITKKTKVIVPVHYAGVACEMDEIMDIAERYNLLVIEDAAQGIMSKYKGKALGSIGHMGTLSFHETKNIISGEGGAIMINDQRLVNRAEIIREKGTNRSQFFRGDIDKYTWVDIGSSYLPSEIIAAFLWAQLQQANEITQRRLNIWNSYHKELKTLEETDFIRCPIVSKNTIHNGHMYYLLLQTEAKRDHFINQMKSKGVNCVFHYIPLHSSPYGKKTSKTHGKLDITSEVSSRLVRLPLWIGLEEKQEKLVHTIKEVLNA